MAEYIEREKTVELLRSLGDRGYRREKGTIQDAIKMISFPEYTPTADVVPVVHGRWLGKPGLFQGKCSICGYMTYDKTADWVRAYWPYCPNCGNPMDGGGEND